MTTAWVTVSPRIGLGVALELQQDLRADLLGGPRLAVDVDRPVLVAHVALDRPDRAVGVRDGLALGDLAHQDLVVLGEARRPTGSCGFLRRSERRRARRLPARRPPSSWCRGRSLLLVPCRLLLSSARSSGPVRPPTVGATRIGLEYSIDNFLDCAIRRTCIDCRHCCAQRCCTPVGPSQRATASLRRISDRSRRRGQAERLACRKGTRTNGPDRKERIQRERPSRSTHAPSSAPARPRGRPIRWRARSNR